MDVEQFVRWWDHRDRRDLDAMLCVLDCEGCTVDAGAGRVRAHAATRSLLRRSGRARIAGEAAHRASVAALGACGRVGLTAVDRDAAIRLARAAGEAASALVVHADPRTLEDLWAPFRAVLVFEAA